MKKSTGAKPMNMKMGSSSKMGKSQAISKESPAGKFLKPPGKGSMC